MPDEGPSIIAVGARGEQPPCYGKMSPWEFNSEGVQRLYRLVSKQIEALKNGIYEGKLQMKNGQCYDVRIWHGAWCNAYMGGSCDCNMRIVRADYQSLFK